MRIAASAIKIFPHAQLITDAGLFSQPYYEKQCGKRFKNYRHAVLHFLFWNGRKKSPHPLFDTSIYLQMYPVSKEYHYVPIVHYLSYGFREMYVPHPAFDVHYYCSQPWFNPDKSISPLQHYIENAKLNPDINPNKHFNTRKYIEHCPNLVESNQTPLEHWIAGSEDYMPFFDKSRDAFLSKKSEWDVLLFAHEASRTGAPLVVLHLSKHIKEVLGMKCLIVAERGGELENEFLKYSDLVILEHHWRRGCSSSSIADLLRNNIQSPPKHVIISSVECYRSMEALHALNMHFVLLMHEFADYYPSWYLNNVKKWASHIIFPAETVKASMVKKLRREISNASVKPQGYIPSNSLTAPSISQARGEIRKELNVPDNCIVILGCGTIIPRKGCDYFVDTAQHLQKLDIKTPYVFVWIGDPVGPQRNSVFMNQLNNLIIRYGLNGNVRFIGSRKSVQKYFLAADVFLLTSRLDPFPYVVMHAMDAAIPVICFKETTGVDHLFSNGSAGYAVKKFDTRRIAEIIRFYSTDDSSRIKAGAKARFLLEEVFKYEDYVRYILRKTDSF
ncbi:MAG TPA: glycosyltransferase family 4 protein [Saprospiraceae bacterium]|nr:glycosyltransferase family 4 protein [Saprospiraceae bacterium]